MMFQSIGNKTFGTIRPATFSTAPTSALGNTGSSSVMFGTATSGSGLFSQTQPAPGIFDPTQPAPGIGLFNLRQPTTGLFSPTQPLMRIPVFSQVQPTTGIFGQTQSAVGFFGPSTTASSSSSMSRTPMTSTETESGTAMKFVAATYTETESIFGVMTDVNTRYQCITFMKDCETMSPEELRVDYYTENRKKPKLCSFATSFGSKPSFGESASSGISFSKPFVESVTGQTRIFGQSFSTSSGAGFSFGTAIKFDPPIGTDRMRSNTEVNTRFQCITGMKDYENKCLEELRFEDYTVKRKGPQPVSFADWTQCGPFGTTTLMSDLDMKNPPVVCCGDVTQNKKSGPFGSTAHQPQFGGTAATKFGATMSENGSNLFGNSAAPSAFGVSTRPTGFGTSTSCSGLFNQSQQTAGLFASSQPTNGPFGMSHPTTGTFSWAQPTTTGPFGMSQPTTKLFNSSQPTTGSFNFFQPTTGPFGTSHPTTGTFSWAQPTTTGAFGTSQPTTKLFNSSQPTTGSFNFFQPTTGPFGTSHPSTETFKCAQSKNRPFKFAHSNTGSFRMAQTTTGPFGQPVNNNGGMPGSSAFDFAPGARMKFFPKTGTDTMMKSHCSVRISTRHQCITCMDTYESKSLEELRSEDYTAKRKGLYWSTHGDNLFETSSGSSIPSFSSSGTAATNKPFSFSSNGEKDLFGKSPRPSTNLFGTTSATGFVSGATFGRNAFNTSGMPFCFGLPTQQKPLFGEPENTELFGTTATLKPSFSFGAAEKNATLKHSFTFGAPAAAPSEQSKCEDSDTKTGSTPLSTGVAPKNPEPSCSLCDMVTQAATAVATTTATSELEQTSKPVVTIAPTTSAGSVTTTTTTTDTDTSGNTLEVSFINDLEDEDLDIVFSISRRMKKLVIKTKLSKKTNAVQSNDDRKAIVVPSVDDNDTDDDL